MVIDSMFVGSGVTPHTPPPEEEPSPDTSIKGIGAWFYFVVYNLGCESSGRKEG
ncbi:MAG: hypothetical protein PVF83_14480 [Anaerolineales bacterium]